MLLRLRELGQRIPDLPSTYPLREPTFGTGMSLAAIIRLNSLLEAPLPVDFVEFQSLYGSISALDIWNGYYLLDASELETRLAEVSSLPLAKHRQVWLPFLPIGGDGGGNLFLLQLGLPNPVFKWNHETNTLAEVAPSFTRFLERMAQDWEHFILGDNDWKYLAG